MFKLKFDKTYDHHIFYKYNEVKSVPEDYYKINDNVFCIADGITKDLTDGTAVKYPENLEELKLLNKYPNPSKNYDVAKLCADKFIEYINQMNKEQKEEVTEEMILDIVKRVNADICKVNEGREINYLNEDLHMCQAAGGVITDNYLYAFSLGDTQITVLDKEHNVIFDTPANEQFAEYEINYLKKFNFSWDNPEYRYMIRRFFRNNPTLKHNAKDITYGALGEKLAEYYINTYKVDLTNAYYICAYSDGARLSFESKKGIKKLIENPESIKESGSEKTLIIYEKA